MRCTNLFSVAKRYTPIVGAKKKNKMTLIMCGNARNYVMAILIQLTCEIPQIKLLEETLNNNQVKMLDSIIKLLEENFPTSAVYYDVAKGDIEEKTVDKDQIEEIWAELQKNIEYIKENHLDIGAVLYRIP